MAERAQIVPRAFWHYVQKLLWPSDLLPIYPRWDVDGGDALGWGLLLAGVAVVVGLWVLRGRVGRGPLAGVLFFGVTLAPTLGVIDYGYMNTSYVADRFQYLAGVGLISVVVATLAQVAAKYEVLHGLSLARVLVALCVPMLVVLGIFTWRLTLNYESPEKFFSYIITNNPSARGGAYVNLGNAYFEQGRIEDAIEAYEQSLENDKSHVHLPLTGLGSAYHASDDFERAESYYRQALDVNPSYVLALKDLAMVLVNTGELHEAEELLQKALKLRPRDPMVLNNMAVLFDRKGDFEEATRFFQEGLDDHPNHEGLLVNYGMFLHDNDRWVEAEPILRRVLEINPQREAIAQTLATVLITLGHDDEAAELVEEGYVESLSSAIAIAEVERGNDLLKAKQTTAAVEAYSAAIAADPDHLAAHVQLGVAYENLDRSDEALTSYRQAYEIDDENISAVYFLGLLSARSGEYEEALVLFGEAEALFDAGMVPLGATEADLPELADVHLNRGVVLALLDRLDEALADIDRALELDPALELAATNREQILGMISQRDEQGR